MQQTVRENFSRLSQLGKELPLNLWLPMAVDAARAVVPPDSGLLKELGALQSKRKSAPNDGGSDADQSGPDAEVYQHVSTILNNIETMVDLYQPQRSRKDVILEECKQALTREMETSTQTLKREQAVLEECKQALIREIESARQTLNREVDFAIADQLFKHWAFRIFGTLLLALFLGLLGIDIWFSQKVSAAQQQLDKMQSQVNEAQLAIYTKASELNRTLDMARGDLLKSRDAAVDVLKNDQGRASKEIDSVKGTTTDQVKMEGRNGIDRVKNEEDVQIDRLRTVATEKLAHVEKPWAVWLLSSWAPSGLAILLSIFAIWSINRS
jgi:hypothetical protein